MEYEQHLTRSRSAETHLNAIRKVPILHLIADIKFNTTL